MNLDPFGHIAAARHFQNAARRNLAECRTSACQKIWSDHIETSERRIKQMEEAEVEYWKSLTTSSTVEPSK